MVLNMNCSFTEFFGARIFHYLKSIIKDIHDANIQKFDVEEMFEKSPFASF